MNSHNSRFAMRRDDDDDDDKPRSKRSKSRDDDDDDDDDGPKKGKSKGGVSPLLLIGGIVAVVMLMGCCLVSIIAGVTLIGSSNEVTITTASRSSAFGANPKIAPQISLSYKCNASFKTGQNIRVVAECAGRKEVMQLSGGLMPNATGQISWTANQFRGVVGAINVRIEDSAGKILSNSYTLY